MNRLRYYVGGVRHQPTYHRMVALKHLNMMVAKISTTAPLRKEEDDKSPSGVDDASSLPEILNIDTEAMMDEDYDPKASRDAAAAAAAKPTYVDIHGCSMAPFDVNPWDEEEGDLRQGTVEFEGIEDDKKPIEYSPVPPNSLRSGLYEFKGIKIRLPKRLLRPETYRWRLTPEEEGSIADDFRVCKYEKKDD